MCVHLCQELYLTIIWMVNSWERTSFRPLSLTNTRKDQSECLMSSNGEQNANNGGTQQNIKEVRG